VATSSQIVKDSDARTSFPEYRTHDSRVNIWGNSVCTITAYSRTVSLTLCFQYGGFWTTGLTSYIQDQNARINSKTLAGKPININAFGITNGCIEAYASTKSIAEIIYNNTYNTSFIPNDVYLKIQNNLTKSGGCYNQINECRSLVAESDPQGKGTNDTVNTLCATATACCFAYGGSGAYSALSGRSVFDMGQTALAPYPPSYAIGYLNRPEVRQELGVPVMFNQNSVSVNNNFVFLTGDTARWDGTRALNQILTAGVKVAFAFGDRDTRCNWLQGEVVANAAQWPGTRHFVNAGYENTEVNVTYIGGLTKQYNALSFTRIFEAGHSAGYFQPQTVLKIFERSSVWDRDVAGGTRSVGKHGGYSTEGPASAWSHFEVLPDVPPPICDIWEAAITCTEEQFGALVDGSAVVEDDIVTYPTA
jgi:carboxypeptidase C (cathepsin A)